MKKNLLPLIFLFTVLFNGVAFGATPPVISSFTPLSAKPGASVTITGTNFNTTAANNIVFFGATKATVTAATTTSLTVTVPSGATYGPITELNTGTALAAYSRQFFTPIFSPAKTSITTADFTAKADQTTGTNPYSAAIGDLDGDGKPDLAVINSGSNTVSVFRNTGAGFAAKMDFATGANPQSVAIGDIDGDGKPDLAVANNGGNSVSVLLNTGSIGAISFAAKVDITTGSGPYAVAIGDLDGDGKPDLAVANSSDNTVSVLRNTGSTGSISFAAKADFATGTHPYSVVIGDLDGDGMPDVATANSNGNTVSVLRNTGSSGTISFAAKADFATGSNPVSIAISDLDGDGKADLATANNSDNTVSILLNTGSSGSISFAAKADFATGSAPVAVAIGDLDGNGKPDLAVANFNGNNLSVLRNTGSSGSISFAAKLDLATGTNPRGVAIGDLDGDGKPDLAAANYGSNTVSVLHNVYPPPTITSFTPARGPVGTSVTITGTNFNTTTANNIVFFGATMATVTAASTTSLTVTVPAGATYQPISVLNGATALTGYSATPFATTFTPTKGSITTNDIAAKVDFTTGDSPISLAIGDLDGDGKPDLAVVNYGSSTVSVYRNTSAGGSITAASFAAKVDFATGAVPLSVAIGDLDGDGKPDLAVTNYSDNTVSVFRNTSTSGSITAASFAARVDFATGGAPNNVAIGDLDGDGKPDLAVISSYDNLVSVFRNTSASGSITTASFASKVDFTTGSSPKDLAIGDLDGDGKPDLAVIYSNDNSVSVLRNTSVSGSITAASFAAKVDFATGISPFGVAIGDLDGDGKPDLAVANFSSGSLSVLRNTSSSGSITTGSFAAKVDFVAGSSPASVSIGDLDGDGKPDLAVANYGSNTVSVFRNTSSSGSITSASFAAKTDVSTGVNPRGVAIGDLDGDGKPDLAAANYGSNTVSVLHNVYPPPTITSFTPASGPVGTSVTLTGTNFNTTTTNNIVFFGATRATVTAATATSLTVTVPAGATYGPVTELNTGYGLAAYSTQFFTPIFSPVKGSITTADFTAKADQTTGTNPFSVAMGDLDGDGKPDLVVANQASNTVSVLLNTGSGFAPKVDFTTGTNPQSVAIGDIDGDGKPDLVIANTGSNTVSVLRNTGSIGAISFAAKVDFATAGGPTSIAITDLDGDGRPDLAIADIFGNSVSVLRNTGSSGSISFAAKADFATGANPNAIAIGDLDGDGKPDLAVTNQSDNTVSVLRNTGSSGIVSFAAQVTFATGTTPYSVAIGDLDGDGKPDLAVANSISKTVSVLQNTGSSGVINFAAKSDFATGASPFSVAIGDLNGDGKPDLAAANWGSSTVSVLRNTGSSGAISFAAKVDLTTGTSPHSVIIGDLDGDGKPDLATANQGGNTVSVLYNVYPPPTITSFTPASGPVGTSVTLTGTNFNTTTTNNIVFFGATRATVTAATATSLTVTVPAGATYGPVTELNTGYGLAAYSTQFFTPIFSPVKGSITTADFSAKADQATGNNPFSAAIGDIDGDGKPDLVIANQNSTSNSVSVLLNTGSGFAAKVDIATGSNPQSVAIGDIDGDGKPDIVTANNGSNTVSVLRNTGNSGTVSFAAKVDLTTGSAPASVAIGDLDGDGKLDLAVANIFGNTVSVLRNTGSSGSISFAAKADFATGANPNAIAIGDLDGDGKPDLAVTNQSDNTVSVLRNTGSSGIVSFAAQVTFATGTTPYFVAIGDLDGDGKADLAIANSASNTVSVMLNTGSSGSVSFAAKVDLATSTNPRSVAIGDLDGDGKADLVVGNSGNDSVSLLRNTSSSGSVGFAAKIDLGTGTNPLSVAIGDLNGDGRPDLVAANNSSNTVSVIRNNPVFAPTTQATAVAFSSTTATGTTISWTNGHGSSRVVFIKAASTGSPSPVDRTNYTANTVFASGTQIASTGWYAVYNGTGSTVSITGLTAATTYQVMVVEYNGTSGAEYYLTTSASGNPANVTTLSTNATLSGLSISSGSLSPAFAAGTTSYTAPVSNATTSITITPTTADPNATIKVNGTAVTSGSASSAISLAVGDNTITTVVTAQDGTTTGTYTITITRDKAAQAVTFASLPAKAYGDADFDPGATSNNTGIPVTYSSDNTAVATIVSGKIHIIKAGTANITASQAGDATDYAAADVTNQLTVNAKAITVTADTKTKTYGDADPALTYQITSGALVGSDAFTGALTRNAGENIGTYAITQGTLALSSNYTLSYAGANLTIGTKAITVTADAKTKTYGDTDPALTYQITSGALVGSDAFTGLLTRDAGENIGAYAIKQGTLALSSNYTLSYAGANLTIGTKAITVTADAKTKTYGDADPALTYQITSGALVGSDAFTGALTRNAGENIGTYAITQGTLALSSNYTLSYAGANLTIGTKAITVTADAKSKTYGDADPALTYQITSGALVGSDAFTGLLSRDPGENTGTYAINQGTLALSSNYTLSYAGANLTINKAALTVTADNQTKVYGSANPALTITYSGFVNGDTQASLTTQATAVTTATTTSPAGTYPITVSGAADNNYSFNYVNGNLTIANNGQSISFAALSSKTYGDADFNLTATATSGLPVSYSSGDVTIATIVNGSQVHILKAGTVNITASQAGDSNYSTAANMSQTLVINKANLTVTADAKTKTYGDADPALTYQITTGTLVGADAFTGSLTRDPGENTGTYAIKQGTLALSSNYSLTYAGANLTIGTKAITVTADAKSKTYGDADPALTYQLTTGTLVGADAFTGSLTRDPGENTGTYAINQGTLALNTNYALTYAGANLTISTKAITVTADARSKTYGDADPALTYQITTGTLVGADAFTGSLTRDPGENTGAYAINQGTLALNTNYALTYAGANLTISTKAITVTADARSKTYGDADPALTYQVTTGALTGTDAFTGSLTRDPGENTGAYAIKQGTLALNSNYSLTYAGANLTIGTKAITVTADAKSKTYGDADPALTYQVTTGALTGTDAFTGSLTRDPGENTGTYAINQGTLALNSNYSLTYAGANLTINKAALTVTADNQSKVFGSVNPALTITYTGFVNGDTQSSLTAVATAITTATTTSAAGSYPITVSGAAGGNYTFNYVNGTLTVINNTQTISFAALPSKTYGDADFALNATAASGLPVSYSSSDPTIAAIANGSQVHILKAGTVTITASQPGDSNYTAAADVGEALIINKASLTVTADNKTRNYGVANPALTLAYSGFVNGDNANNLTSQATATTTATTTTAPGNYQIIPGGAASGNYSFNYVNGTLTITALSNINLSSLAISSGRMSPSFSTNTLAYQDSVENVVDHITLTAVFDPTATANINGISAPNGSPSPDIPLTAGNTTVDVVITAQDGVTQKSYTINVYRGEPALAITATNILSPNGDGKNDTWVIKDIELYPGNTVTVYDRAGRVVYTKQSYKNDWDGTLKGSPLAQGTYYYIVDLGPGQRKFKGFITILRSQN